MTELNPLNTANFFCPDCGIGERGNCPGFHATREIKTPGSNLRAILILSLAIGVILVAVGLFSAWRM